MNQLTNHKKIKLVALDMDGTLLNKKGQISDANRRAIKEAQEKGIVVVLSTGRSIHSSREHAEALELTSYLVTVNGSEIWDHTRSLVERNLVNSEHIQWMWEITKKYQTKFWALSTERSWHNEMPEDIQSLEWLKFGFHVENDDVRERIKQELTAKNAFELTNSSLKNIEVNSIGIHKARALKVVCSHLGIQMNNVMAVGDSLNDLMMIKEAGLGVAMGNAQELVKQSADWVTCSNDQDGVAQAIYEWVI